MENKKYVAYTDGSADNLNTRRGGAAYIIIQDNEIVYEASKKFKNTTNNRMEMLAIISAVNHVPEHSELTVYSDSQYAINVFNGKWKPKINKDLIDLYHKVAINKTIILKWIKGHSGNKYGDYVDKLASYL